jgi:hypothetical protein
MEVRLALAKTLARCGREYMILTISTNDYRRAVGIERVHSSALHERVLTEASGVIYRCLPCRLRKRWYVVVNWGPYECILSRMSGICSGRVC